MSTGLRATAPGKVLLAGEYAVLVGAEAVVMAVDRRVVARVVADPATDPDARAAARSPFIEAVAAAVAAHAGADSAAARAAQGLAVDSRALRAVDGIKLGLGSSAAVTVAACACALAHDRMTQAGREQAQDAAPDARLIHRLAHAAHGAAQSAQGARGSGADIAASVYGGILSVRVQPEAGTDAGAHEHGQGPGPMPMLVRPLLADLERTSVHLVFVWTGAPASTPALVARVQAWRDVEPRAHERAMTALADAALALIAALRPSGQASETVAAIEAGAEAAAALGRAAGVEIETAAHRAIAALARTHRGAAKPTGAGGGDIALAAFANAADAAAFRHETAARGMKPLALRVDPDGVRILHRR
jgi:phosphomevalonate kinase